MTSSFPLGKAVNAVFRISEADTVRGQAVLQEQFRILVQQIPVMYGLLCANALFLSFATYGNVSAALTFVFPGLLCTVAVARMAIWCARRAVAPDPLQIQRHLRATIVLAGILSLGFGGWGLLIFEEADLAQRTYVALFVFIGLVSCSYCLQCLPSAGYAVLLLGAVPMALRLLGSGDLFLMALGLNLALIVPLILRMLATNHAGLIEVLCSRSDLFSEKERTDIAEKALRQSEALNRGIIEASPDCLSLLNLHGTVLYVNGATLTAYNLENDAQLLGRPWGQLLPKEALKERDKALVAAQQGRVGRLTVCLPNSPGEPRWLESLIAPVQDSTGKCIRLVVMSRDITHQKSVEDQVRWSAGHDPLTQLPNRTLFQQRLDRAIQQGPEQSFALLVLDIDDFKQVNDTLGHDAGDVLLCMAAKRLRGSIRQDDFVARLGGDEFAIILNEITTESDLTAAAQKILDSLKKPWVHNGRIFDCRVSIGASLFLKHGDEASQLLKNADIALYAAKLRARGSITVFQTKMCAEIQEQASMLAVARNAVRDDLSVTYYQPKVDFSSGRITGFEALLRWRHPTRGIQHPASLAAAFEHLELAADITERMVSRAVSDMGRWLDQGIDFGHVAINAAAADFRQPDFAERLLERLDRSSIPRSCLQVEVTETVFLGRGADYVERALKKLSAGGIRIALDDFGTGYASLSHLKQFPVDIIKIDRSFVRDIEEDGGDAAIIGAVVNLGRSLNLEVIAEGVETVAQEAYLMSQGCHTGQGYLYGKAAPAIRVPGLIQSLACRVPKAA